MCFLPVVKKIKKNMELFKDNSFNNSMLRQVYSDKKNSISTTFLPWIFCWFVSLLRCPHNALGFQLKFVPCPGLFIIGKVIL